MRIVLLTLLTLFAATGCLPGRPGSGALNQTPQQQAFFLFLDAETAQERERALQALQRDYPQSPLTAHALTLQQAAESAKQREKINQLTTELNHCQEASKQQKNDNEALRKDLEKLKQLVIEMERREH